VTTEEAFNIVLCLAFQNVIPEEDNPEEYARQIEAIDTIEDYADQLFGTLPNA